MASFEARKEAGSAFALALFGSMLMIALASLAGVWFAPFMVGLACGTFVSHRGGPARAAVAFASITALGSWSMLLLRRWMLGEPVISVARVVAALAELPSAWGWLVLGSVLVIAVGQGALGAWCGASVWERVSALARTRPIDE